MRPGGNCLKACLYQTDHDLSSIDPTEVYSENNVGLSPLSVF